MSSSNAPSPHRGRAGSRNGNRGGGTANVGRPNTRAAALATTSQLSSLTNPSTPSTSRQMPPPTSLGPAPDLQPKVPPITAPPTAGTVSHSCAYDISLLENDGSNFAAWKVRAETVLDLHNLWTIVDRTLPSYLPQLVCGILYLSCGSLRFCHLRMCW